MYVYISLCMEDCGQDHFIIIFPIYTHTHTHTQSHTHQQEVKVDTRDQSNATEVSNCVLIWTVELEIITK